LGIEILALPHSESILPTFGHRPADELITSKKGTVTAGFYMGEGPNNHKTSKVISSTQLKNIRITILGYRKLPSAPEDFELEPLWVLRERPLDSFVEVDVLYDEIVPVDYKISTIFTREP